MHLNNTVHHRMELVIINRRKTIQLTMDLLEINIKRVVNQRWHEMDRYQNYECRKHWIILHQHRPPFLPQIFKQECSIKDRMNHTMKRLSDLNT